MPGNHGLAGCLGSTSVPQNRGAQVSSKPIRQIDEQTVQVEAEGTDTTWRVDFVGSYFLGEERSRLENLLSVETLSF